MFSIMSNSHPSRRDTFRAFAASALIPSAGAAGDTIRFGAIGAGNRGREHLATMRDGGFPGQVMAICDIVPEHAAKAVEICGGAPEIYQNYRRLLERDDLNAVIIATPNFLHKEMAIAALEAGKHVLCEKPMARNVAECDAMIRAWRDRDLVFCVGLQNRFHPLHVKIRELIAAGAVGQVRHLAATEFRGDWKKIVPGATSISHLNWRFYDALSGGSLLEKHCHDFDLFSYWMGSHPVDVCGTGGATFYDDRDSLDHASIALAYDNGCTVSLDFNVGIGYGKGFKEWTLVGDKGQMFFQRKGTRLVLTTWEPERKTEDVDIHFDTRDRGHTGTLPLHRAFFDAMAGKPAPVPDPFAGRQSVRVGQAAEMAVRQRRVVPLHELG